MAIIQRHGWGESTVMLSIIYTILHNIRFVFYDILNTKQKLEQFMKSIPNKLGNRKILKQGKIQT